MRHTRIVLATGTLLAALALGVGQAAAHGGHHANSTRAAAERQNGVRGAGLEAAATYLGVTEDALTTQLKAGKSLAQVADATAGKSSAGLIAALTSAAQAKLDAAVTAGKLTAAQEQKLSARLTAAITKLVNATQSEKAGHGKGALPAAKADGLAASAAYLGVTVDALKVDLKGGKSLAQIADATSGKSSAGLISALTAAAQAKLDAAVTAGKLTADQEQKLSAKLTAAITKLVNATQSEKAGHGEGALHAAKADGLAASAAYLGVTVDALKVDLQSGKSLAQVADATAGKSSVGLIAALTSVAQAKLDAAVTAGKLTADQEQKLSAKLTAAITKLVERTRSDATHG